MEIVIVVLIGLAIGSLIGAVFLRKAAKWVKSLDVPFGEAYAIVFISWLIGMGVGSLLGLLAQTLGLLKTDDMTYLLTQPNVIVLDSVICFRLTQPNVIVLDSVICWLVQAGAICWRFSVTFGKALLISLVTVILSAAISIGIVALIGFGIICYSLRGL